jgi:hypothetical protein
MKFRPLHAMSSATISNGRALCTTASRIGSSGCRLESFFSCSRFACSNPIALARTLTIETLSSGYQRSRWLCIIPRHVPARR